MPPLEVWSDAMNEGADPRAPEAGSTPPPLPPGPPTGPAPTPPSGPEPTPEARPEPFWVRRRRQQAEKQALREGGDAPGGELKQTRAEKRRAKQEERRAKREARRAERQATRRTRRQNPCGRSPRSRGTPAKADRDGDAGRRPRRPRATRPRRAGGVR